MTPAPEDGPFDVALVRGGLVPAMNACSVGTGTSILAAALGLLAGLGIAAPASAGIGPENTLVIIDPTDSDSLAIGNHYIHARSIPATNVLYLTLDQQDYTDFATGQVETLLAEIQEHGLDGQIDALVTASQSVYRLDVTGAISETVSVCPGGTKVHYLSLTGALSLARQANHILAGDEDELYGLHTTDASGYYSTGNTPLAFDANARWLDGEQSNQPAAQRLYVAAMLGYTGPGGNSVDEILAMIDRSVAADATLPTGTFYYMKTSDAARSSVRDPYFAQVITDLAGLGGQAVQPVPDAVFPTGAMDCLGILTAWPNPDIASADIALIPGAYCDHVTSFGAAFDQAAQTKISAWIAKGASASHGTVEEPCPAGGKFVHPRIFVYYFQGLTIGESIYRSLGYLPFQSLVYGDPLTRPFAQPPLVSVADLPTNGVTGMFAIHPQATAQAAGADIARLELYADGLLLSSSAPGGPLYLSTGVWPDGPHELRVVAVDDSAAAQRGTWTGWVATDNAACSVQLTAATASIDLASAVELNVSATGGAVRETRVKQNGRVVATTRASSRCVYVQGDRLGAGVVTLQAETEFIDGRRAVSWPIEITVERGGACCHTDGTCHQHSQTVCEGTFAGLYAGDGTTCAEVTCPTCATSELLLQTLQSEPPPAERGTRSTYWGGDFDASGDVDLTDFMALQTCLAGTNGLLGGMADLRGACACAFDFTGDGLVNQDDVAGFVSQLRGPVAHERVPLAYANERVIRSRGPQVIELPMADQNADIADLGIGVLPTQADLEGEGMQRVLHADAFASGQDTIRFWVEDEVGGFDSATIGLRYELPAEIEVRVEAIGEPGAYVNIDPPDVLGRDRVQLPAVLAFDAIGATLELEADDPSAVSPFVQWVVDGAVQTPASSTVSIPLLRPTAAVAAYKPRHVLKVLANRPGTSISNFTPDVTGAGSGVTPFDRVYEASQPEVFLSAPSTSGGKPFHHWRIDGVDQGAGSSFVFVPPMSTDRVALAIYSNIPGDYDDDYDFDLSDLSAFQLCFSGPADAPGFVTPSAACLDTFDLAGGDGDIDLDDWLLLESESVTGPF